MKKNKSLVKLIISLLFLVTLLTVSVLLFINRNSIKNLNLKSITNSTGPETHSLKPISSNQWYSSVYNDFPTQPLFAYPLAYKISENGLTFSYPRVNKTPKTVFASYIDDFSVGTENKMQKPKITAIGDWNINLEMTDSKKNSLDFALTQGLPYTIIESSAEKFTVKFNDIPELIQQENANSLIFKVQGNMYGISSTTPITTPITNRQLFLNNTRYILISLLNQPEDILLYQDLVKNQIITTTAIPEISGSTLNVKYTTYTQGNKAAIGLLPHQYNQLSKPLEPLIEYPTLRGILKVYNQSDFETTIDLLTPADEFTKLNTTNSALIAQLKKDVDDYIKKGPPDSKNYFLGTWLGKGTTLYQLADTLEEEDLENELFGYIYPILEESMSEFYYNEKTTSVIAKRPEFGNEKNNDHLFHYGYYIRAAAILAKNNPTILAELKKPIDQLVDDIATTTRQSPKYPYLRNFSIYESHSWADGFARAADGNNQESSSEAINGWYSIYLWGKITNNTTLSDYGLYLYNSEIQGAKYYWFGYNDMYTPPYEHEIASIVWGGKVDFATWFSDEANMKYGIQLLPITPASAYLGTFLDFPKYEKDFLKSGGSISESWGDLFLIWKSFYNPEAAYNQLNTATKPEDNVPKSLLMYMLLKNKEQ